MFAAKVCGRYDPKFLGLLPISMTGLVWSSLMPRESVAGRPQPLRSESCRSCSLPWRMRVGALKAAPPNPGNRVQRRAPCGHLQEASGRLLRSVLRTRHRRDADSPRAVQARRTVARCWPAWRAACHPACAWTTMAGCLLGELAPSRISGESQALPPEPGVVAGRSATRSNAGQAGSLPSSSQRQECRSARKPSCSNQRP